MTSAPRLVVYTPAHPNEGELTAWLAPLSSWVDLLILRWPGLSDAETVKRASRLASFHPRPRLALSGRWDLAVAAGLEGVHLKDEGVSAAQVKPHANLTVGQSVHDAAGIVAAGNADYVVASPVFSTASKPGHGGVGLRTLRSWCDLSGAPVLALGGVDASHVRACLDHGAHGIAVLSAVWNAADPGEAARELRGLLNG